ncbi:NADH-ubiquinone oxidoreductase-F iron-sulfur binding region domain-containing protein [Gryllotalpicola kribbensis]|uniref:NADH-ubiquinone oxidoreductase-F iron-sulfur binding region domain-containing protein n=1 Tax=Gryllotalpicola kribbensis TaxID=993084 RepID=A0ABP8AM95_9MICO
MTIETTAAREPETRVIVSRLLAAGPDADFARHLARFGAFDPAAAAPRLLAELEASGLTGRGGAGFAAWRKCAATADARDSSPRARRVVIGNGAEGEPFSRKDETLLRNAPHLVIDGLLAAAAAVGASELYLYAGEPGLSAIHGAVAERADGAGIRVTAAADTFLSGQASAVVNAIATGRPLPRDPVGRLSESGLRGRPTLLHNVETLAHIGLIARYGADWFRAAGTAADPGTRLVTVAGDVPRAQVLEVHGGARIDAVLEAAGADPSRISAVLVGGYHGAWLTADQLGTALSPEALTPYGAHPGAGILLALDRTRCAVQTTAEIIDYLAGQSARQCGPCLFGLPALAASWRDLAAGAVPGAAPGEAPHRAWTLADAVDGRGACAHPDGTARLSRSALRVFAADIEQHRNGRCLRAAH